MKPVDIPNVELEITSILWTHFGHHVFNNVGLVNPFLICKVFEDELYLEHFAKNAIQLFSLVALGSRADKG